MHKRTLQEVKTNAPDRIIRVQVYYSLGGMNYFAGKTESRGLFLSVVPIELREGCECFTAFTGYKQLVLPMKAFSAKKLAEYAPDSAMVQSMVDRVRTEQKLGEPQ